MHALQFLQNKHQSIIALTLMIVAILGIAWLDGEQGDPKLDDADTIAITKASFLFQFAKSNDWPENTKNGSFKIGIQGNKSLYNFLIEKYSSQSIGNQMLEVVWYEEGEVDEYVNILYTESDGEVLDRIIESIKNKPIMLVTSVNAETSMPDGAVINFIVQSSRIRYELDMENALARGLIVGNRILSWAVKR
ncbi:MAG: hypothetical protein COA49_08855 [Bacteroidetes bacterium]|nr:MAG: hypothetical protein COA49_08855 [Bacteroidota bacterium]